MEMILLLTLLSFNLYAGFSDLSSTEAYLYKEEKPLRIKKVRKTIKRDNLKDLMAADLKIAKLLKELESRKIKTPRIIALTRTKGILLNSVLAMNVRPSTFIVRITAHKLLKGGELRCIGLSFEKRIPSRCNLLVLKEKEYEVDVALWDLDGANGIIADYLYSGEEKAFLTSSLASFFSGVMSAAKDRIITPFGEVARTNAKNTALSGLSGISNNAVNVLDRSGDKKLSIAYVNSGKKVLIFFNQSFNL